MELKDVIYEKEKNIATIIINRPKKMNALNANVMDELGKVVEGIKKDENVRVSLITGSGDRAFVAGADVEGFLEMDEKQLQVYATKGKKVLREIETMGKPVIAAINGFAFGGGLELAMACHIRIASENAQFGLPEAGLGLIPGYGGTQRLPRLIGKGKALEMLLTGDPINAEEAFKISLINRVVPLSKLRETCLNVAEKILSKAPLGMKYVIEAVNRGIEVNLDNGSDIETELLLKCYSTEDRLEGIKSFLEKRKPQYKGK